MYHGWYVVGIAGAVYAVVLGTTFSAFGLFVVPVSTELRLSRADMNTALILLNAGGAILAPVVGRMLDRMPARRIMVASALLAGLSFVTLSLSNSLWLSAIAMGLTLAAAVQGAGTITMSVLLARWFTVRRGRAMLLAFMGASLGGILIVPVIGWLIAAEGWRATLLIMAGTVTGALLLLALPLRERPRPGELEGEGAPAAAPARPPLRVGALLRMPQFWSIGLGCSIALAIVQTIMVTIVPLAIDEGFTAVQAASLISVAGGAALASKLLLSFVADRFDRIYLLTGLFALGIVVSILLLAGSGYIVLMTCALLLGVSSSALAPILYALIADRFDIASFGTVRGMMAPMIAVAGAIAIRAAGEVFDRFGGYDYMFYGLIAFGLLAIGLILATRLTSPATTATTAAPATGPAPARA